MGIESGIYAITHSGGRTYVGSAINIKARFSQHRNRLRKGDHPNIRLRRAWIKYGATAFTFSVLEYVEDVLLLIEREQHWIDLHSCNMYNMCPTAGSSLGRNHSPEAKEKVRIANIGRVKSPETRQKLRLRLLGKPQSETHRANWLASRNTPEAKARRHTQQLGRVQGPETREKLRMANLGKKQSDEAKLAMSKAQLGRKHSEETKSKMSASASGKEFSDAHKANIAKACLSPERLAISVANLKKASEANRGKKRPPFTAEHKAKLSAAAKAQQARRRAAMTAI